MLIDLRFVEAEEPARGAGERRSFTFELREGLLLAQRGDARTAAVCWR
jgi:hypothetical protein